MESGGAAIASPHSPAAGAMAHIDGYVADSIYPSTFHPKFAPAWTDAILRWHGVRPPRSPRAPFTFVDLGCGNGVGLILLAAAYPEARFVGIDGLAGHIDEGERVARTIGLDNLHFHCRYFAEAHGMVEGEADYVMAQGVWSWIRPDHRLHVLDLAAAMLRPGGVLSLGYNSLPGWSPLLGFQKLAFALAQEMEGGSAERFDAAVAIMREREMVDPSIFAWLDEKTASLPRSYFAHEYLNRYWAPSWSGDVIEEASRRDLTYLSQAHPGRLRPDFTMKRSWREALALIGDPATREIAADLYVRSDFRTDIYIKGPVDAAGDAEANARRLDQWWAAPTAEEDARYAIRTPAGRISYDNDAAHAILRTLENGPAPLRAVQGFSEADLLNTVDALQLAALVLPADPASAAPKAALANQVTGALSADGVPPGWAGAHGVFSLPAEAAAQPPAEMLSRLGVRDDGLSSSSIA